MPYEFNTPTGQTVKRDMLATYLNVGTEAEPDWKICGLRVTSSSMEYDWNKESYIDIIGRRHTNLSAPTITQSFDPCPIDAGDNAIAKIWNTAIMEQDYSALSHMDVLVAHLYAGFGERYNGCTVTPTSLGGDGGSHVNMPFEIDYGGERTKGTVTATNGSVTFTAESQAI